MLQDTTLQLYVHKVQIIGSRKVQDVSIIVIAKGAAFPQFTTNRAIDFPYWRRFGLFYKQLYYEGSCPLRCHYATSEYSGEATAESLTHDFILRLFDSKLLCNHVETLCSTSVVIQPYLIFTTQLQPCALTHIWLRLPSFSFAPSTHQSKKSPKSLQNIWMRKERRHQSINILWAPWCEPDTGVHFEIWSLATSSWRHVGP